MAPKVHQGSGSKSAKSHPRKYRVKSSLFRQPPLVSDTYDSDPIFTTLFSNRDRLSTSNPSDPLQSNSTHLSSDSSISFRRERLGLYVENYAPPPEPQYKGLQAAHKEPQPKPVSPKADWGAWDIPEPKTNNEAENTEPALWGGAPVGDNSVQWAPTSGKGRNKKKNKARGLGSQGHFMEPPVSRIKLDIQEKGIKWRTSPIGGGFSTGPRDTVEGCKTGFMPWDTEDTDRGADTEIGGVNPSSLASNAGYVHGQNAHDSQQQITQPRSGFHSRESPRKPFIIEVSDDEENEADDDDEDEEQSEGDITV
ncbi:hypothetical protein V492_07181 [Pseudogymnoascus sp. VKM F-4246]|nr:hypothetical protein V492_07181 [Pseudogymnoascus sp. VKM F-4246]